MSHFDIKAFVIKVLRRVFYQYPPRKEVLKNARQARGKYECNICKNIFGPKEIEVDHIEPVIEISGFIDWNTYISRLFCSQSGLQVVCKPCHREKSNEENKGRRNIKSAKIWG